MALGEKQRIYQRNPKIKTELLAKGIEQFLVQREDMVCRIRTASSGIVIQTKKKDDWKKYLMLDNAVNITLSETDQYISVIIGGGKWKSKVLAAGIGTFAALPVAVPLLALSSLGGLSTYRMPDKIFEFIDMFMMTNGQNVLLLPGSEQKPDEIPAQEEGEVTIPEETKPEEETGEYSTNMDLGTIAQPQAPEPEERVYTDPYCSKCASKVPPNSKFCPGCGRDLTA